MSHADSNETIRWKAKARIAKIFSIPVETLHDDDCFGEDLQSTFVSAFRMNELDIIYDDLMDVASRSIYREFTSGRLKIVTVAAYCEHLVRCNKINPSMVEAVLNSPTSDMKPPERFRSIRALITAIKSKLWRNR